MSEERKRILQLLADGKLTVEQADLLLAEVNRSTGRKPSPRKLDLSLSNLPSIDRARLEELKHIGSQVTAAVSQSLGEVRRQVEQQIETWSSGPSTSTLSASTEVSLPESVQTVAVEARNGRIQITSWDEPTVRLHVRGQVKAESLMDAKRVLESSLQADRSDDSYQLTIAQSKDAVVSTNVDIYVPRKFGRLICKTHNGTIHADTLDAVNLQVDSSNGNIWVHEAEVERLRATAESGNIELLHSITSNCRSVYASTKNGKISVDGIAADLHCVGTATTVNGKIQFSGDVTHEFDDPARPNHARFELNLNTSDELEPSDTSATRAIESYITLETKNGGIRVRV
ncbi:SHOCT-like domain-containing protein [Alicyclobacillus sp. ALC3]|uniref:SHOCT-like domain-containing protein n=1 Tax=Alicyclobacillus sp. ALC3 TaxID=2796143 RepID=UPI0023781E2E|nr:DUF4097 family beta strand repeat-containing protein [Alicyclobacillus sp. ALC3]WDL96258.1 DUF4097 family beta strand repeat protein [Alicyclobacillus sp. ALC3]